MQKYERSADSLEFFPKDDPEICHQNFDPLTVRMATHLW